MGIVRRQSIKTSLVFFIGIVLGYFNILWIMPYCLSTDEIGLVRLIVGAGSILASFIPLGVQNTTVKYFPFFEDKESKHSGFFLFILGIPIIGGILVALLFYFFNTELSSIFQEKSPLVMEYWGFVFPLALIITYHKVLISYSRSLLKTVVPNFFQSVVLRVFIGFTILLYFFGLFDLHGLIGGYLISYTLIALLLFLYIKILGHLHLSTAEFKIPWKRIWEMIRFGMYLMLTAAGQIMVRNIDTIMLGALAGLSETGIYSIAFFIGVLIETPKRAVIQITSPLLAKARKNNDLQKIRELYHQTSINHLLIGSLLFIGIWVNLDDLFAIMPNGETFAQGKMVVLLIGGAKLFDMSSGLNSQIIMTSKHYRFNFISILILLILVIGLNFLLIPKYGLEGAALASFIAISGVNLIRFFFLLIKEKMQPFDWRTVKGVLLGGLTLLICSQIPDSGNVWINFVIRSGAVVLLYGTGAYFLEISRDANDLMNQLIKKYLKK